MTKVGVLVGSLRKESFSKKLAVNTAALFPDGYETHLRQPLVFLNMPILQQPEAYIGNVADLLDENGKLKDEGTVKFLQSFVHAFVDLIRRYFGYKA
ncbi:NAD(P)H-dependent oxidoreductase [Cohnella pontilimi]|uniref:NAD(P)H-dependent oxidoreductase n=1 Tax=Cohnella pontilimi TaxID=2564100 RepID=A0A4U0F9N6_9BACL|nr:NAD(P)H-dependent oxidoreductase [Cohnella pontilimi]TJY41320.1 NAD(P)H-dependent oxidoreductase [Cohnella pontilimi]